MFSELTDMNRSLPSGLSGTWGDGGSVVVGGPAGSVVLVVGLAVGGSSDSDWTHSRRGDGPAVGGRVCPGHLLDNAPSVLVVPSSCL
jgi:hypothetical protein